MSASPSAIAGAGARRVTSSRSLWARFSGNRAAVLGLAIVAALCLLSIIAPFFTVDPDRQNVPERMQSPSWHHLFGTDDFGRDLFSRVVNGGRVSLLAGFVSVAIGFAVGALIGIAAGYYQRRLGTVLMAMIDLLLALPPILLAISLAARFGSGLNTAMISAGIVGIPGFARIARASTLSVNRREFTDAARTLGASNAWIIRRHILPNIVSPLIVQATVGIGAAILLVSALGFLGLGAQPPQAEWGRMLNDAKRFVFDAAYMGIFPGLAIALTVFGFNLAGDGLRDALERR